MTLSLIVAMTRSGAIGSDGTLPWKLPADLARFKALTMGHCLLMGRKTFESLGRVLPGRTTIVVTRQMNFQPPAGVLVAHGLELAVALAAQDDQPFVIGGGEIYALALPRADQMHVTWVEADIEGDTRFPAWNPAQWRLTGEERHSADAKNQYDYTFSTYRRLTPQEQG